MQCNLKGLNKNQSFYFILQQRLRRRNYKPLTAGGLVSMFNVYKQGLERTASLPHTGKGHSLLSLMQL